MAENTQVAKTFPVGCGDGAAVKCFLGKPEDLSPSPGIRGAGGQRGGVHSQSNLGTWKWGSWSLLADLGEVCLEAQCGQGDSC